MRLYVTVSIDCMASDFLQPGTEEAGGAGVRLSVDDDPASHNTFECPAFADKRVVRQHLFSAGVRQLQDVHRILRLSDLNSL